MDARAIKAKDVMTGGVITLRRGLTLREALELLSGERISGAPVVDESGKPVGVLSVSDIILFQIGKARRRMRRSFYYALPDYKGDMGKYEFEGVPEEILDSATVGGSMTQDLIIVAPDTPLVEVAETMVRERIHRVIVVENDRVVGVISALDMARAIAQPPPR